MDSNKKNQINAMKELTKNNLTIITNLKEIICFLETYNQGFYDSLKVYDEYTESKTEEIDFHK
ncbi:MAG: hypothetical protein IJW82_07455 [Clostridia bacterium]|nr:hypothetical protein [Clostridia bacterium]